MDNIKFVDKEVLDNSELEEFDDIEMYIDEVAISILPSTRDIERDSIRNINYTDSEKEDIIAEKCYTQALAMAKAKLKYNNPPNIK